MRKNLFLLLGMCAILLMSSCSKKEVKILSNQIEGDLKGCFTIQDSICEVQKDADGHPCIVVNITRTEESVPFTPETIGVFGEKSNTALTLAGFGYESYDNDGKEEGDEVSGEDNEYNKKEQLDILKLAPGEKGKLTITFKDDVPEGVILTTALKFISTGEITLNGAIGKYGIKNFSIDFNYETKRITGQYQYLTSPAGSFLYLIGKIANVKDDEGNFTTNIYIAEDNGQGELTGIFKGQLKLVRDSKTSPYYYVMAGTFRNYRLTDFRYNLKSVPLTEMQYGSLLKDSYAANMDPSFINEDFSMYGFGSFDAESGLSSNTSGDVSVDEFIRQYKKFYKQFISVAKKAKAGDLTVSLEYIELVEEYAKFAEKLNKMKGQISADQLSKLMQMQAEMLKMI